MPVGGGGDKERGKEEGKGKGEELVFGLMLAVLRALDGAGMGGLG